MTENGVKGDYIPFLAMATAICADRIIRTKLLLKGVIIPQCSKFKISGKARERENGC